MERHETMMRAARYLLGAGAIAVAMVATTAQRASAETEECIGEVPTVCGHAFTEAGTGDHSFQVGEGTPDITVVLTDGAGNVVATSGSNPTLTSACFDQQDPGCGYYSFDINEPGDYLVCIVLAGQSMDCSDATEHPETQHVTGGEPGQTADFELPSTTVPPPVWGVGTGTPGYWKNHPEAWPGPVTVGGVTYGLNPNVHPNLYDAIKLMGKVGGDKTLTMFASLISAKLNSMLDNNTECIAPTILLADAWMTTHQVANPAVKASSPAWLEGEPWHQKMDDYNNGKLCAPHRD